MLILHWFLYCFIYTALDKESDGKPKMLILYWFLYCFMHMEAENVDFTQGFPLFFSMSRRISYPSPLPLGDSPEALFLPPLEPYIVNAIREKHI